MKTTILLSVLLAGAPSGHIDLCDAALQHPDGSPVSDSVGTILSRYCQWSGPDVPVWDQTACCELTNSDAACAPPNAAGRCELGSPYYCEYGELTPAGGLLCYQPYPDMCDAGLCIEAPEVPVVELADFYMACCSEGGACMPVTHDNHWDCQGSFLGCDWGVSNADGTVDCYHYL